MAACAARRLGADCARSPGRSSARNTNAPGASSTYPAWADHSISKNRHNYGRTGVDSLRHHGNVAHDTNPMPAPHRQNHSTSRGTYAGGTIKNEKKPSPASNSHQPHGEPHMHGLQTAEMHGVWAATAHKAQGFWMSASVIAFSTAYAVPPVHLISLEPRPFFNFLPRPDLS